ncbi:MAG: hypothetical protein ABGZ35_07855 [Planctomycetaceae bacterium]
MFHWTITTVIIAWSIGAWWFQQLLLRDGTRSWPLYAWSAMDVILFTAFLRAANGPASPIVIGYLLLIAVAGLRFKLVLVWLVFGLSVMGYLLLHLDALVWRPDVRTEIHAALYFLIGLFVMAGITHLMLRRMRSIAMHHSESGRAASDSRFNS